MRESSVGERLDRLRSMMAKRGIQAWIATTGDAHLSEYIGARWQTRAWLSGFRGSAGRLVVTRDFAGLWVDSRYHQRADADTEGKFMHIVTLTAGNEVTIRSKSDPVLRNTLRRWQSALVPACFGEYEFANAAGGACTVVQLRWKKG